MVREVNARFFSQLELKKAKVLYTKDQIMNVFKSFDKDNDGQLSKAELQAAFTKLGSNWSTTRARFGLWHADADDDGFISISKELDKLVDYAFNLDFTLT